MRATLALACLGALAFGAAALYTAGDAVLQLNSKIFNEQVLQYDGVALVEFYAPWCGHCQSFSPQFKKLAEKLKGIALVGAVDCDNDENKQLCAQYQIKGFPSFMIFPADKQKNPKTGELMKIVQEYGGPRSAKTMLEVIESALTDVHVTRLATPSDLKAFREKHASKPQVLLFSTKEKSTLLYNGLSTQLRASHAFALVHESAADVVQAEGVDTFPTLKVIKPDGNVVVYSGQMNGASLKQFLDSFVAAATGDDAAAKAPPKPAPPPVKVANLTVAELPEVDKSEAMWLVAFVKATAEECQEHIARYLEVVRDLEGVLQLGVVRATAEDLPQLPDIYGVDRAALEAAPCEPQVVRFPFGANKTELAEYQKYQGEMEAKAVQKWALEAAPDSLVTEVTSATYHEFVGIEPPFGGEPLPGIRVFLFTGKAEAPAMYRALAAAFKGRAAYIFGFMNMQSAHNRMMIQVAKLPTLALAVPTLKDGTVQLATQPYMGVMKLRSMYLWLLQMAEQLKILADGTATPDSAETLVPAAEDTARLNELCTSKPGLCVLCLLDAASPAYASHLGTVTRLAAARMDEPLHFIQIDAPLQPQLLRQLGVLRSDIPTVVALSPKWMRYAVLPDAFSDTTITRLLDDVVAGRARTTTLQEPLRLEDVVDAALDAAVDAEVAEAVEEEFDLSDILGEEVEGELGAAADKLAQVDEEIQEEARRQAEEVARQQEEAKKAKKKQKSKKNKSKKKGAKKAEGASAGDQGDVHDEL